MADGRDHNDRNSRRHLAVVSRTHIGLHRQENQDYYVVRDNLYGGTLLVVADGMGGHRGGKEASRIAADAFTARLEEEGEISEEGMRRALDGANDAVVGRAELEESLRGMGTTLVAVWVRGSEGLMINLGDSRGYMMRGGRLEQITRDHGVVAEMVERGELTPEEAEVHPRRNVLSQAIGMKEPLRPDVFPLALEIGDILLLCTDGLSGMIDDREIERVLASDWSPEAKGDSLIEAALDGGGRDNVTLILAELTGREDLASGPPTGPGVNAGGEKSGKGKGKLGIGGIALIGAILIGGGIWGGFEFGLFGNSAATDDSLNVNDLDSTWQRIDSTDTQSTPADQITDSLPNDSLPDLR